MSRRSVGLRVVGELVLIVVGVLVAFQFEAARERAENRSLAQAQLDALHADLTEMRARLLRTVERQEQVAAGQLTVIRVANGDDPMPSTEEMRSAVNWAGQFFRVEVVSGAYDALVASGDLRLIEDPALRSSLANLMADLKAGHEDEPLADLLRAEQTRALAESTSLLSVMRREVLEGNGLPASSADPDFDALLSNRNYLTHVTLLRVIEYQISRWYAGRADRAGDLIASIEALLDGSAS